MNMAPIDVPDAIRTWADDVAAHGGAAVLFGSRANRKARPDSDWDIAVVGDPSLAERVPFVSFDLEVQLVHVTLDDLREQRHVYPGIVYEIAKNGVLLAGKKSLVGIVDDKREIVMDAKKRSDDFGRFVGGAIDYAWNFILQTDEFQFWDKFGSEWRSDEESAYAILPARSADAAEFVAKAVCLATGSDFGKVHDVNALAKVVPEHLRDRVRGLNGNTHNDHMAGYADGPSSPREVYKRVVNAMSLLADMAQWQAPLLPDRAHSLAIRLSGVAQRVANHEEIPRKEPVVRAFMDALSAWRARTLEVERGSERDEGLSR